MTYEMNHLGLLAKKYVERAVTLYPQFEQDRSEANFNALALECMQAINYFEAFAALALKEDSGKDVLSYIELVDLLHEKNLLSENESGQLKHIIHLRNKFAHKNYAISDNDLKEMVEGLRIVETVIATITKKY